MDHKDIISVIVFAVMTLDIPGVANSSRAKSRTNHSPYKYLQVIFIVMRLKNYSFVLHPAIGFPIGSHAQLLNVLTGFILFLH